MKSPEFIAHGTTSSEDAKKIEADGFFAQQGRATVSADLIYAFGWATEEERRRGSKSESEIDADETGRIIILKTPEDREVDFATHTDISIDDEKKEVTGYSLKYVGGRKQLGIYSEGDSVQKRKDIEGVKQEIADVRQEAKTYLEEVGLDASSITSKEDLISATDHLDVTEQIQVVEAVNAFRDRLSALRQEAEVPIDVAKEDILMSIVPSPELGAKLGRLKKAIYALETIDLDSYVSELASTIEADENNFLVSGVDVEQVMKALLVTTLEAEVMTMVRSLAMDVKRAQGYTVFNRGGDDLVAKQVNKDVLKDKLESVRDKVEVEDFDIGVESLNRYIKMSLKKMLEELH